MEAQGSVLTNKYAEGYPNRRYYGGCEFVDVSETLAIERAKQLFGAEHVNVQPHSGSQANMAVYLVALEHGDTVLGMNLSHGGQLTHGAPVNFSGQFYKFVEYGVDKDSEQIDYDEVLKVAKEHQPKLIVAGASAYSKTIDFKRFREIADEVGAKLMVDMAHIAGLVAVGLHPSPVAYADFVTTTTHKTLRGPRGGMILCKEEYKKQIDKTIFPGIQGGPLEHVIAAKAQAFSEDLQPEFTQYINQVIKNSKAMAEEFKNSKKIRVVSGGTDNHLMIMDITNTGVTGKDAQNLLDSVNITTNKESIPGDKRSPFITSGLRIGTPAITSRGFKELDAKEVAKIIIEVLDNPEDAEVLAQAKERVKDLVQKYPIK